jgi:hypothetical protein
MPCRPIGLEQHRGAGDVDVGVHGQVGQVHAEPDHGGLVAHRVHPGQRLVHRRRIPHVAFDEITGNVRRPAVVTAGVSESRPRTSWPASRTIEAMWDR